MLRAIAQTLLGLVLAATPVVLWVAWSPALFVGTFALCALSAALLVLLTEPAARDAADGARLPQRLARLTPPPRSQLA